MSYELRGQGFTRTTCHLSQKEVDEIRTALTLLPEGSRLERVVDTFMNHDWSAPTNIPLTDDLYLEAECAMPQEEYIKLQNNIIPYKWVFNLTKEIPF